MSYDKGLEVVPFNVTHGDWVERFPYQNGLVIWKWDTSQQDNNTGEHPGVGLILPVDAHPKALRWSDGTLMDNNLQSYDSPFTRPAGGVKITNTNTRITIGKEATDGSTVTVQVGPAVK